MSTRSAQAASGEAVGQKYLTFNLADEEYALEIGKVYEIIRVSPITTVPRTPNYFRGIVNLRGKVIPVVDLRKKFAIVDSRKGSCIVVVQARNRKVGILVNHVSDVVDIPEQEIEDPTSINKEAQSGCIQGVNNTDGHIRLLLDIDKALAKNQVAEHPVPSS